MKNINIPEAETVFWEGTPDEKASKIEAAWKAFIPEFFFILLSLTMLHGLEVSGGDVTLKKLPAFIMAGFVLFIAVYVYWLIKAKLTHYIVTNRAVYMKDGLLTIDVKRCRANEILGAETRLGLINEWTNTMNVYILGNESSRMLKNIPERSNVYELISKLAEDQNADKMYPNILRPRTNAGYKTEYRPQ